MKSCVSICIFLFTASTCWAQDYVPLSFSAGWKVQVKDTPFNTNDESGRMQFIRMGAGMAHAVNLKHGQLVAGLRYDRLVYQFNGWPTLLEPPHVMHHARLELIGIRNFEDRFTGTLFLAPGFATSFSESISVNDLSLSLAGLLAKSTAKNATLGLGFSYIANRKPAVLPLLQINWEGEHGLSIQALLPSSTQFWYALTSRLSGGLSYRGQIAPFHTGTVGNRSFSDFQRQLLTIAPALRFAIRPSMSIQLEAGTPLRNRLTLNGAEGELQIDHERGLFIWGGLILHR